MVVPELVLEPVGGGMNTVLLLKGCTGAVDDEVVDAAVVGGGGG
jgi:hypothetical protein